MLLLATAHVATAQCRARQSSSPAAKRPLIINVRRAAIHKPPCPQQPRSTCERAGSSRLVIKDSPDRTNSLVWKWRKGAAFAAADVGDPSGTTEYALCVYDSFEGVPLRMASLAVEPGGGWSREASGVWKYKDAGGASAGVTSVLVKSGATGKTTVRFQATGKRLRLPSPASRSRFFRKDGSVVVQLVQNSSDKCWTSTFTTAKVNSDESFVAP
ncbi:MAG: hypothetical protein ABR587_05100 [Candidatus Binatia bacterium]